MARPRKKLTDEQIQNLEELGSHGCTNEEIAAALNISADTLTRRFADAIKKGKLKGMVSAKRMLYAAMMAGNLGARIWFGKQYMGEKDRTETENLNVNTDSVTYKCHFGSIKGSDETTDPKDS